MRQLAALLESEIRRDPGQWVVQQPIFESPETGSGLPAKRAPRSLAWRIPAGLGLAGVCAAAAGLAGPEDDDHEDRPHLTV